MKAIMYGAGNIGRGFIGQLFSLSGYEVVFIDVDEKVVDEINLRKRYPIKIVSNDENREEWVENIRAVNGRDAGAAADEISGADIVATAVGARILPKIAPVIAAGLKLRFKAGGAPLNIIICENLLDSGPYLKKLVKDELPEPLHGAVEEKVGFVEASVGRMVPQMTEEMREGNPLKVWVEPYNSLPVDKDAFVGEIPSIINLKPFSPFDFHIKQKLFVHNLGHAACAYLGKISGYTFIWQAVGDEKIKDAAKKAMRESAAALSKRYAVPHEDILNHIENLTRRFANKALSDSVARVGRDPLRKLSPDDRLAGAAAFCKSEHLPYDGILKVISAALLFLDENDESSVKMAAMIEESGRAGFLQLWSGLGAEDAKRAEEIAQQIQR